MPGGITLPLVDLSITYTHVYCYNTYDIWNNLPIEKWQNISGIKAIFDMTEHPDYPDKWTLIFVNDGGAEEIANLGQVWSISGIITGDKSK